MGEKIVSNILEKTLLYDFYGELLTEHQKNVYEDVVLNDYSLSEVAAERGISRQGVHDLIKRCNGLLDGYEEKLHLVERFINAKNKIHHIDELVDKLKASDVYRDGHDEGYTIDEIDRIAKDILEDF